MDNNTGAARAAKCAWLDGLSDDDWPQYESESSYNQSQPSKSANKTRDTTPASRAGSGRGFAAARHAQELASTNSSNVLSERSFSEINIFGSRRSPSKLSKEFKVHDVKETPARGRLPRRSLSASSLGSVIHNTIERKPHSASPGKSTKDTPDWKRLALRNLENGEQRDLFSPARTGLENMFQPPVPASKKPIFTANNEAGDGANFAIKDDETHDKFGRYEEDPLEEEPTGAEAREGIDLTMPSSPPVRAVQYDTSATFHDDSVHQKLPEQRHVLFLEPLEEEPTGFGQDESDARYNEDATSGSFRPHSGLSQEQAEPASYEGSQLHHPMENESRMVSGQSVLRNESFSAIMVSPAKNRDGSGGVVYTVGLPPDAGEVKRRLENLRWNHMALADDVNLDMAGNSAALGSSSVNLDNINFRRGGRSADGSFRDRMLSPPIGNDTSEMLPEESLQASTPKQFASVRIETNRNSSKPSPMLPRVPNPSPEKQQPQQQPQASDRGVWKLFGSYDTLTSKALQERIRAYEDPPSDSSHDSNVGHVAGATVGNSTTRPQQSESRQSSAQFGAGELDGYRFSEEEPHPASQSRAQEQNQRTGGNREPNEARASRGQGELHVNRMRESRGAASSRPTTAEKRSGPNFEATFSGTVQRPPALHYAAEVGSEGKRARPSPSKDSTPKRRRTLHRSDVAFGFDSPQPPQAPLDPVVSIQPNAQSVNGRKRRDARDGDEFEYADPEVLASRNILRPRTPTPSQRSSVQREQHPELVPDEHPYSDADSQRDMANSYSSYARPPGPATGRAASRVRKPSMQTDDYMQEANMLINMMRLREELARGGLASVEESEMELSRSAQGVEEDTSFQESTKEPFSRPPSREGRPLPSVARVQQDPDVVARLKKYEERSDLDDIVTTTTRSINLAMNAIRAEKEATRMAQDTIGTFRSRTRLDGSEDISDPPNIRVSMNPGHRRHQQLDGTVDASVENPSQGTQGSLSSGHSTGNSIPSRSSRGSDTRKTIAPEMVAHLIPDQVCEMVLDRDQNIWVKRRNGSGVDIPDSQKAANILPSEGSEEDPFAEISDLTVDEVMENRALKPAVSGANPTGAVLHTQPSTLQNGPGSAEEAPAADRDTVVEHEISIDEGRVVHSSPSRKRHLAISFSSPIASIIQDFVVGEGESKGESNGDDESMQNASTMSLRHGRRTVSVKFKSTAGSGGSNPSSVRSRSTSRGASRTFSVAGQSFVPRPVSRIDEREEDDTHHFRQNGPAHNKDISLIYDRSEAALTERGTEDRAGEFSELTSQRQQAHLDIVVTTPGVARHTDDEEVMAQYVGMLSLSPMPDFTIHQDRSLALEASYVLGDRHLVTGDNTKAVMSQGLSDLVDRLAEVEPFEPYWEDMEELDVQGKRLESLHKLEEFCPNLVTLDATSNTLRNLNGVPSTVRHLRIVDNQLSELTSWARLGNLQYVDISNNDIKTLSGLKNLVHLRGLKADNCGLENLDGLKYHDGLQTLRARGNRIASVDFDGTRLHKLVELDLEDNQITSARNLDQLTALAALNLQRNALDTFAPAASGALPGLRTLNVSDNQLTALDVRTLPALRVLFADRNCLSRIRGFSNTPRLDTVSLREQALVASERLDISSLYHAYEIRKLYLSGNRLDSFDPPVDFLNLHLLELANCGLTSLPANLAAAVPNLRKANLNFNALTDLRPLGGIGRLKKALVAGNRLAHAYSVIEVLAEMPHLTAVDLRDNPLTQGFYPPIHASVSSSGSGSSVSGSETKAAGKKEKVDKTEPFALPAANASHDKAFRGRLDMATAMRRRVYSQVFADACGKLQQLDGLGVDRTLGELRDEVWRALNAKGIISGPKAGGRGACEEREESRWAAEDTFA